MINLKIIIIVFGLFGLLYLLPHEIHVRSGLDFGLSHVVHQILGFVLLVVAFALFYQENRWEKKGRSNKGKRRKR